MWLIDNGQKSNKHSAGALRIKYTYVSFTQLCLAWIMKTSCISSLWSNWGKHPRSRPGKGRMQTKEAVFGTGDSQQGWVTRGGSRLKERSHAMWNFCSHALWALETSQLVASHPGVSSWESHVPDERVLGHTVSLVRKGCQVWSQGPRCPES